jgi:hypothetical protein
MKIFRLLLEKISQLINSVRLSARTSADVDMAVLKQIKNIRIGETMTGGETIISLTFTTGKEYSLWTPGRIQQSERYISIMQPIGKPFPNPGDWPKETIGTFAGNIRTVTPY